MSPKRLSPHAEAFATILTVLVDPRTPDEDLESIAYIDLNEDVARKMLVALAAMHSGYIQDDASRLGLNLDQMMKRVRREIRQCTVDSEQAAEESA